MTDLLVSVVVDVPAVTREFTYAVPAKLAPRVAIGSIVRVPLHGRRVRAWVVAVDVAAPPGGVAVRQIAQYSSVGPSADMIDLCRWASWRWAGRLVTFLRAASPPKVVASVPARARSAPIHGHDSATVDPAVAEAFDGPRSVLRLPPAEDPLVVVAHAATMGPSLVVCPSIVAALSLARRLRGVGVRVAVHPDDWVTAAAGGATVVGARAAAFAPMPALAAVVVVDEHDEALQQEGSPTWHAREVCLERARRARVAAVMVSPCPSLESQTRSPLVTVARQRERDGWPVVEVIDRRDDDSGRTGLYSHRLVTLLREATNPLCVLNRTGRSKLLACATCSELARCERCGAVVGQDDDELTCARCGLTSPVVCLNCGGQRLKNLRQGVARAAEELESLVGPGVRIGTEAALHDEVGTDLVAFLDMDQELLAPRYRATEQALTLLVRAARRLGERGGGGRLVVQTRNPDDDVLQAALRADPAMVSEAEGRRRSLLAYPPAVTMAVIGGEAAPAFVERLGEPLGVEVLRSGDDDWLLRSADRAVLLDALGSTPRPAGRLRLQIDPMRIRT